MPATLHARYKTKRNSWIPWNGLIKKALADDPPARISDGKVFRTGFHAELDGAQRDQLRQQRMDRPLPDRGCVRKQELKP